MTSRPQSLGLYSSLLNEHGFRHAFFMRNGGVSRPPYATLNFSTAGGDDAAAVATNLARAATELGVAAANVFYLSQVHGCEARQVRPGDDREALLHTSGDITVSDSSDVACGVRMADCPAVLLADCESGAVAAVHSGWRGTVQGAAIAGVEVLRDLLGRQPGRRERLIAAIGPHIERCCFEVGQDVADEIAACSSLGADIIEQRDPRPHVDLRRALEAQLRAAGVEDIDHVPGCTMCDAEHFHSYRRDGPRSGRMLAAIVPAPR